MYFSVTKILEFVNKGNKMNPIELTTTPRILKTDATGLPQEWISIEDAISYYATDSVIYELGNPIVTYRGGINRITNEISEITANSIIAVRGEVKSRAFRRTPSLTNKKLFERDRYLCAYCGDVYEENKLSRDHIKPSSKGGQNIWNNVVTACKPCNGKKGDKTLEESKMKLLYLPYTPDVYENLILHQGAKRILADQMEFLLANVSKKSRLKAINLN